VTERQEIPELLYHAVAQVIAYVFSLGPNRDKSGKIEAPNPVVPDSMLFDADGNIID